MYPAQTKSYLNNWSTLSSFIFTGLKKVWPEDARGNVKRNDKSAWGEHEPSKCHGNPSTRCWDISLKLKKWSLLLAKLYGIPSAPAHRWQWLLHRRQDFSKAQINLARQRHVCINEWIDGFSAIIVWLSAYQTGTGKLLGAMEALEVLL